MVHTGSCATVDTSLNGTGSALAEIPGVGTCSCGPPPSVHANARACRELDVNRYMSSRWRCSNGLPLPVALLYARCYGEGSQRLSPKRRPFEPSALAVPWALRPHPSLSALGGCNSRCEPGQFNTGRPLLPDLVNVHSRGCRCAAGASDPLSLASRRSSTGTERTQTHAHTDARACSHALISGTAAPSHRQRPPARAPRGFHCAPGPPPARPAPWTPASTRLRRRQPRRSRRAVAPHWALARRQTPALPSAPRTTCAPRPPRPRSSRRSSTSCRPFPCPPTTTSRTCWSATTTGPRSPPARASPRTRRATRSPRTMARRPTTLPITPR